MLRRSPLRRTSPLARRTRLRPRGDTKYRRRPRDFAYMGWVKRQVCMVSILAPMLFMRAGKILGLKTTSRCSGPIEADHMGARGMGQKADDRTCVPMCSNHHRERHAHAGTFFHLNRDEMRAWRTEAIAITQAGWENR